MPPAAVRLPIVTESDRELPLEPLRDPRTLPPVGPPPVGDGPLRTSRYTVLVDLPEAGGDVLLVHGYAGTITRVSARVASFLRARRGDREDVAPAPSDSVLAQLVQRGYVTRATDDAEVGYFRSVADTLHVARQRTAPSYVFLLTYDCNLRCTYCYQSDLRAGATAVPALERSASDEVVARWFGAIDRIDRAHGLAEDGPLSLTLYGGEPLLARNRPTLEAILGRAARRPGARISAVTNGTELAACADLLGPHGISLLQVTLDGPREVHDRRRIHVDGSGSFDQVIAGVALALERGAAVDVRVNVCGENVASLGALADELDRLGWLGHPRVTPYVAAVHRSTPGVQAARPMTTWQVDQAIAAMARTAPRVAALRVREPAIEGAARALLRDVNPMTVADTAYCGAQTKMYVFDRDGDIYACWERTGAPHTRIGRIGASGEVLVNARNASVWRDRSITSNETCVRCAYATFCGGGCAAIAEGTCGTTRAPACDGFKQRFRATVARIHRQHQAGELDVHDPTRAAVC